MSLFKSTKCAICKDKPGHRFCFRKAKDICWLDCNELRIDKRCPGECDYKLTETDLNLKAKVDSIAEYKDVSYKLMNHWLKIPQKIFGDEIPLEMAKNEEGKQRICAYLGQFQFNKHVPLSYLKEKLSLSNLKVNDQKETFEDRAKEFISLVITQDWKKMIDFMLGSEKYQDPLLKKNYLSRMSSNKILNKVTDYFLVSSALADNGLTALVYFVVNGKYDLVIKMQSVNDIWWVQEKLFGKPEIINSEFQANNQIANLLSQNMLSDAFELLEKYFSIFVDSADINYYRGMYYMFSQNYKSAEKYLLNAVEIDPAFLEARSLYGTALLQNHKIESAKQVFSDILNIKPDEIKSLNNLATIFMAEGNNDEAQKLLRKCLEIDPEFIYAKQNLEKIENSN
jgi:tetratricopeptide (TPR) repeat protein